MFPAPPGANQQCMPCCPRPPCTSPYTYSSVPRALFVQRKKYRNPPPNDGPPYGNLMFDRRVVRGSTYAQHPIPQPKWNPYFGYAKLLSQTDCGESQAARQMEARRRALARRRAQGMQSRARCRLGTPPPLPGRKHEPVQTEKYLEELWERPPERDVGCQTELFLDRPESPFYVPAKTGVDVETQIYPGDLFDFDVEVVPILEVLVGKTMQQAMLEVLEEEELAALRAQQNRFLEMRAAEEAERRRLEEQERRMREEAEARLKEFEEAQRLAKETESRVAAAVLTQGYLADLLPSVLDGLKDSGYLMDECAENVRSNFMPWLMKEVQQELDTMVHSREIIMEMVREILEQRADLYREMAAEDAEKLGLSDDEMGSEREPEEPLDLDSDVGEEDQEEWHGGAGDWADPNAWGWDKPQGWAQPPDWDNLPSWGDQGAQGYTQGYPDQPYPAGGGPPQGYGSQAPQQQGYPPKQQGFPPQQVGYQPQEQGYPPQQQGFPPQQQGFPPQQQGFPPQQQGFPPQQQGFPPQQQGFPPQQQGFPPQQQSYPPQQQRYPSQQQGYPPQQQGYPPQQQGYPPQQQAYQPPPQQGYSQQGYPPPQKGYSQQVPHSPEHPRSSERPQHGPGRTKQ